MNSTSLNQEYARYMCAQSILKFATRNLSRRQTYEMRNIVERWFLNLYNRYSFPTQSLLPKPTDSYTDEKAIQEMVQKKIYSEEEAQAKIQTFWEISQKQLSLPFKRVQLTSSQIGYGNFQRTMTPRLQYLLENWSEEIVLRMLLRYESILPGGQHWGVPWSVMDILYELGFHNEGFASPLNSRFIDKPKARFGSLFLDTDQPFGSIGPFHQVDMSQYSGSWAINPPAMEEIFQIMEPKILDYLDRRLGRVFVSMAHWEDTSLYQTLLNHPQLIQKVSMNAKEYYYESPNREKISPPVKSVYFILGDPLPSETLDQIREAWYP